MTETRKKDIAKEYIKENIELFGKELDDLKKDLKSPLNDIKSILGSEKIGNEDNELQDVDILGVNGVMNVLFKKNGKQRAQVGYELLKSIFIKEESKQKLDLLYEALKKSKTEEELRQSLNNDLSQLQTNVLGDQGGYNGNERQNLGGHENTEITSASNEISDKMFNELLGMEGNQSFIAKIHNANFGETFVTGPYGMVYKHIDQNGNLLQNPVPFKDGEKVSSSRAAENAKAYYNKKAKKWKDVLNQNGCEYTQDMLDALVSASGGTIASYNHLKDFVISHWNNKEAIYNFRLNFATKAAGNGKVMPGLVRRRKFEANRFKGIKKPFSSYSVK